MSISKNRSKLTFPCKNSFVLRDSFCSYYFSFITIKKRSEIKIFARKKTKEIKKIIYKRRENELILLAWKLNKIKCINCIRFTTLKVKILKLYIIIFFCLAYLCKYTLYNVGGGRGGVGGGVFVLIAKNCSEL